MHMTFSDLVRHSPEFPLATWPGDITAATINSAAAALIETAATLTAKREIYLLHNTMAVVSLRPQDWPLARVLACFGAHVHFICPAETVWDPAVHPQLFECLRERLEHSHPHLNVVALENVTHDTYRAGDNFRIERRNLLGEKDPLRDKCQFTFVIDLLDAEQATLSRLSSDVRAITQVGGCIEILGSGAKPAGGVVEALVQASGHLGLGLDAAARGESWPGPYRVSFSCLSSPTYEYPRGDQDHAQLLAHCEARLRFAAQFMRGARVLEAGCGTGIGARLFRSEGATGVVCLDYSNQALDAARRLTNDSAIEYHQWDLNKTPLPLPSEAFDVVVCLEVIEHIENQEGLVAELYRVLKPGGRVLLSIPNKAFEDEWIRINRFRNIYHVRVPTREDFEKLLCRFTDITFARQIDFVGSTVIEDGRTPPSGNFAFQTPQINRDMAGVIFAVGRKGQAQGLPQGLPPVQTIPQMRLYENYLTQQLDWRRDSEQHRQAFLSEQLKRWSERNFSALASKSSGRGDHDATLRWIAADIEAYSYTKIPPGPWMDRTAALLRATRNVVGGSTAAWEIEVDEDRNFFSLRHFAAKYPFGASVVFPKGEICVSMKQIWRWRRAGVSEVWFFEPSGWKQVDMAILLARRLFKVVTKATLFGFAGKLGLHTPETLAQVMVKTQAAFNRPGIGEISYPIGLNNPSSLWPSFIERSNQEAASANDAGQRPLRVMEYTGALYPGGAERQFCNVAVGLKHLGVDVDVLTTDNHRGERGHYRDLLHKAGIAVRQANKKRLTPEAFRHYPWHLLQRIPHDLVSPVLNLAAEISANPPDVLHCWLDQPNLIGGMAGLMAGVPAIIMSTRNSNPTLLPRIDFPYLQEWYKTLALSNRVHFIANSHSGAESYANWLGLPVERFNVIFNGVCFDHFPKATPEARKEARAHFGLGENDRVVCGAFRLAAEKQPELFLDVIRRVRAKAPNLRVLLAGAGDLDQDVRDAIHKHGMSSYVQQLGRRNDVGTVLLAADVCLLTSFIEGCPNIALEAQHLGVPMVATAAGGTVDAIDQGHTGFLAGVNDAEALANHVVALLRDNPLRAQFSAAAPEFIRQRFGLEVMIDRTFKLCRDALEQAQTPRRTERAA